MAKGDELVTYITARVVRYIETPKEERRNARLVMRQQETWAVRWFGQLPLALQLWLETRRERKKVLALQQETDAQS